MIGYVVALLIYLAAAAGLVELYRRFLKPRLAAEWGRLFDAVLLVALFTPWFSDNTFLHFAPASIIVLFSLMAKDPMGVLRGLFPLLLVGAIVAGLNWRRAQRESGPA